MSNKLLFFIGIIGVSFFGLASILGGFQFENYDPISQYISETMAIGTPYGKTLRLFGYIPSGILLTLFSYGAYTKFPKTNLTTFGFWGLAIFYGIATIVVAIFPCDQGCNKELINPSISQLIHNLTGLLTYIFVPISILLIGIGLRKSKNYLQLSNIGVLLGILCIVFVSILSDPLTSYAGLYQRIIESLYILWIIACAIYIKKA
ncbi:MAG: hypothetical protein ACI849_001048 [Patiriisocius sp.]|jgi:hypothetical protein